MCDDDNEINISVGDILDTDILAENYQGAADSVCVIADAGMPPNTIMFIKDRKVVAIHEFPLNSEIGFPGRGEYDAIFIHPDDGPQHMMGADWVKQAEESYRKLLS